MKLLGTAFTIGSAFIVALLVLWLLARCAGAHSFYSKQCCEQQDCHPVPCGEVTPTADGGWTWHTIKFDHSALRESQDAGCHVCVTIARFGRCIYLPWGS